MKIQLSDHFTYRRLLRFVFPSILMILCTSVYSIVDGFFVSNFAGKTPFAALNLIMPVLMGVGCIGFMLGTGEVPLSQEHSARENQNLQTNILPCLFSPHSLAALSYLHWDLFLPRRLPPCSERPAS